MGKRTLDQLRPGETAYVVGLDPRHPLRRLELGFVRGAPVTIVRCAPMGDPLELRVNGADLALRAADLRGIRVRG